MNAVIRAAAKRGQQLTQQSEDLEKEIESFTKGEKEVEEASIESMLEDREKTHGPFKTHALITQHLKGIMHDTENWEKLTPSMKESLEMTAHKIGRILAGRATEPDHWADIAGYNTLVALELTKEEEE